MPFTVTISTEQISFCTGTLLTLFVKRLDLHIAFFKEKGISEVHMSCRCEENISGYQKVKVQKNHEKRNSHIKNHD